MFRIERLDYSVKKNSMRFRRIRLSGNLLPLVGGVLREGSVWADCTERSRAHGLAGLVGSQITVAGANQNAACQNPRRMAV